MSAERSRTPYTFDSKSPLGDADPTLGNAVVLSLLQFLFNVEFHFFDIDKTNSEDPNYGNFILYVTKYLYLYKYENVCLSLFSRFFGHFVTDWETLWHKASFCF